MYFGKKKKLFLNNLAGFIKKPAFKPACQKTCANPDIMQPATQKSFGYSPILR
jgi:hypothetical protein